MMLGWSTAQLISSSSTARPSGLTSPLNTFIATSLPSYTLLNTSPEAPAPNCYSQMKQHNVCMWWQQHSVHWWADAGSIVSTIDESALLLQVTVVTSGNCCLYSQCLQQLTQTQLCYAHTCVFAINTPFYQIVDQFVLDPDVHHHTNQDQGSIDYQLNWAMLYMASLSIQAVLQLAAGSQPICMYIYIWK